MSAHFLRRRTTEPSKILTWLENKYAGTLGWTLRHRVKTFLLLLLVMAVGITPFKAGLVKASMFSGTVNKRVRVFCEFDDFHYKSEAEQVVNQLESYLYDHKDEFYIDSVYSFYGENRAESTINLTRLDFDDDQIKDLRNKIRENLPVIPGVRFTFSGEDADQGGDSTFFAVKFFGQDAEVLKTLADEAERRLGTLTGVKDLSSSFKNGRKEIQVSIDKDKAARLGMTAQDVSQIFSFTLGGLRLRRFNTGEREVETWIALQPADRTDLEDLRRIQFLGEDGTPVQLADIATFQIVTREEEIRRENRKVTAGVYATYEGKEWGETQKEITGLMNSMNMPPGYVWSWNDRILEQQKENAQMGVNFLLALILVYLVLASLFESLAQPFAILFSILFALPGAGWMLAVTGTPFNLMAQIGLLILMGIVVNNGIVLLDRVNHLRKEGMSRDEAIVNAGRDRLRPILMTASTTVIGLLPLAMGGSMVGGLFYYPMARTVMGGLISSSILTLMALPYIAIGVEGVANWLKTIWAGSAGRRVPAVQPGVAGAVPAPTHPAQ